jgi:prevent-host-death family protein
MTKEKILTFVEARANLSEIVDRVNEQGETFVVAKRQKPVAVIIGIEKYRQMAGAGKYLRDLSGKRVLRIGGIAKVVGDVDAAIRSLRKSRLKTFDRSL